MPKNKNTGKIPDHLNRGGRKEIGFGLKPDEKERLIFEIKQNKEMKIRFSELEKQKFLNIYNKYLENNNLIKKELSVSKFTKNIVFNKDLEHIYKKNNLAKISFEINKVGNNINQIAKKINSYQYENIIKINNNLDEVIINLKEIYKILNNI